MQAKVLPLLLGVLTVAADELPETATFAAGCFWSVELAFQRVPGVLQTKVGYAGGTAKSPTYQDVVTGRTGHAEAVQVVFDKSRVSFGTLLELFWEIHDPTTPNRQVLSDVPLGWPSIGRRQ
jgi:methionine-S-sulfoxide reductase